MTNVRPSPCALRLHEATDLLAPAFRRLARAGQQIFMPTCPVLLSLCFSAMIALSDARLAANMGLTQLAAMSFCEPLWFLVALLTTGLCSGISVGYAQKEPTRDRQNFIADTMIMSGIIGGALVAAALMLSVVLHLHPRWFSNTAAICSSYFFFCCWSNLPFTLMQAQCAIFRAACRGRCVLVIWLTAALTEVALGNIFFYCGWRTLDALATAWVVGCLLAAGLGVFMLAPLMVPYRLMSYLAVSPRLHLANINLILKIGLPVVFSEFGLICGSLLNLQIISCLPNAHISEAAWAIKSRLEEAVEIVPITAIGLVVAPFMSRHGLGNSKSACWSSRVVVDALFCTAGIFFVAIILVQFTAPSLALFFVSDEALVNEAARVISIGSLAWPFFAVSQILFCALEGSGRATVPTIATIVCSVPLRLALANSLKDNPQIGGMMGITISGVFAQVILALTIALLFRRHCRLHRGSGAGI